MSISKILLLLAFLIIAVSCKKEKTDVNPEIVLEEQSVNPLSGNYIGNLHHQGTFHKTDFARYDSITGEPIGNDMVLVATELVDTIFKDTVRIEIINDTILFYVFDGIYDFLINEENKYAKNYPGYTSTTFSVKEDTLNIFDTYLINRGAEYPSQVTNNFIGTKRE